jgi:hypothetical protein
LSADASKYDYATLRDRQLPLIALTYLLGVMAFKLIIQRLWVDNKEALTIKVKFMGDKTIPIFTLIDTLKSTVYDLDIAILEEALCRSREINQSQVGAWLLSQFQQQDDY